MSDFSDLHDELRSVAAEVLAKEASGAVPWAVLAQTGWTGLEVSDDLGGAGAGFRETAVIMEEIGRAAGRTGYLGGPGLSVGVLTVLQAGDLRDELLRGIAEGGRTVAAVLSADHETVSTAAPFEISAASAGCRVQGRASFVPDAAADTLLLVAVDPTGAPVVVVVPVDTAGVTIRPQPVVDETRSLSEVVIDDVTVSAASVLHFDGDAQARIQWLAARAATAIACDSLGLSEAMLAATVTYVSMREQFGRPIGSFQAVKHACADMMVTIAVARQLVDGAVEAVAGQADDARVAAARAKAYSTEAAVEIAGKAMQLHGGIGYTWESGIHIYLKRATLNRALFGSPAAHRKLVAQQFLT
jgi:alkylation response protein AidB-like acyl-CoA dehydrogenase